MNTRLLWIGLTLVPLLGPIRSEAQSRGSVEFGLDAALSAIPAGAGKTLVTVDFPIQSLRVGFFVSDVISLEPSVGVGLVSYSRDAYTAIANTYPPQAYEVPAKKATSYAASFGAALALHGNPGSERSHPFAKLGPVGRVIALQSSYVNEVQDQADKTQFGIAGGIGWKWHVERQWGFRLQADVTKYFKTKSLEGDWVPSIQVGLSFWSRGDAD